MISTGFFTKQGLSHTKNQDSIIAKEGRICIADGCSTASFSEVGSAILSHVYLQGNEVDWFGTIHKAKLIAAELGLEDDSLCSTLMSLYVYGGNYNVQIVGDGTIIGRRRDSNSLQTWTYSHTENAPYYLRYALSVEKSQAYISEFSDLYTEEVDGETRKFSLFDNFANGIIVQQLKVDDYDFVAVCSDGIDSFLSKTEGRIDRNIIIPELMRVGSFAGNFIHRRCNRAMQLFNERGWHNADDFSMGAIYTDQI